MGHLTTITFRNDCYHDIEENKNIVIDEILTTMSNGQTTSAASRLGMIPQKPVHSNDDVLYMSTGNTVVKVDIDTINPVFYETIEKMLESKLADFKRARLQAKFSEGYLQASNIDEVQQQLFIKHQSNMNFAAHIQNTFDNAEQISENLQSLREHNYEYRFDEAYIEIESFLIAAKNVLSNLED